MKRAPLAWFLLQVVILHKLDGVPLRVDANKIEIFTPTISCKGAGAVVTAGGQKICVKESLEQICKIIEPFKKCESENAR